jgi:diamine N-acetyltransferase
MIYLEKIKEKDLSLIAQWEKNKLITEYVDTESIITLKEQLNWFEKIRSDKTCKYWIINNYGIKIGMVKLSNIDFNNKICTLEYYIGDLHFRGRKITPILVYNIYEYIFEYMNFKEIRCIIKASNKHAIHISENMGCTMDEKLKDNIYKNEKNIGNVFLFIDKEKWNKIKNNYDFEKIIIE